MINLAEKIEVIDTAYTIRIPANSCLNKPIHIVFLTTNRDLHLQNKIIAETNSNFTLIEEFIGPAKVTTQILAQDNSQINYYHIQKKESAADQNITLMIQQEKNSTVQTYYYCNTIKNSTISTQVKLLQENARYNALGLSLLSQSQKIIYDTRVDHFVPNCTSNLLFKNVANEFSTAEFCGRVVVYANAENSETHLTNKNLLLAPTATINTKPELEIYADNVVCTHGATVGQLDLNALFYLQTRGFSEKEARELLLYGFMQEIIEQFAEPIKSKLAIDIL